MIVLMLMDFWPFVLNIKNLSSYIEPPIFYTLLAMKLINFILCVLYYFKE